MGWNPVRVFISFFSYEFVQHNSYNTIRTVQIVYKFVRILTNEFIQSFVVFVRIRIKPCNFYTSCIVRIHTKCDFFVFSKSVQTSCERAARAAGAKPKLRARSTSREGEARAESAQREPRARSASTPPAPTRPHPAAPTIRVHPAAPTNYGTPGCPDQLGCVHGGVG